VTRKLKASGFVEKRSGKGVTDCSGAQFMRVASRECRAQEMPAPASFESIAHDTASELTSIESRCAVYREPRVA
jgi:hypothetical protein